MSKQEIRQEAIIEEIFNNFDSDGSGFLTNDEMVKLFESNKVLFN